MDVKQRQRTREMLLSALNFDDFLRGTLTLRRERISVFRIQVDMVNKQSK